jgi:hypothetical protein
MAHSFFIIGLGFILAHEMDAVKQKEWTIFPGLSALNDRLGYYVFTAIHVPLYFLLFYGLLHHGLQPINTGLIKSLDIFFIIHVVLHILYLKHRNNLFRSAFSWSLIAGAGVCGLIDLTASFIWP